MRRKSIEERAASWVPSAPESGPQDLSTSSLIGPSPEMIRIREAILLFARCPDVVLLTGETGTGKQLVVEAIHRASGAKGELITVDCAAADPSMLGSELFGHVAGAFTGAVGKRAGAFVEAEGSTLFLDEIHRLSEALQAKLLRAFDPGRIKALGAERERPVKTRVVVATNQPLKPLVASGAFLPDLFHRLQVLEIELAPLRNRPEDIEPLLRAFASRRHFDVTFDDEARSLLRRAPWPGNVRELQNGISRLAALRNPFEGEPLFITAAEAPIFWPSLRDVPSDPLDEVRAALTATLRRGPVPGLAKILRRDILDIPLAIAGSRAEAAALLDVSSDTFAKRLARNR